MSVNAALTSNRSVRVVLLATLVMLGVAVCTYVALRLRTTYQTERQIGLLQQDLRDLWTRLGTLDRDVNIRLSVLERLVYEQGPEPVQVFDTPAIELWQKNRDRELRERLQRLERWRLEHAPVQEDK